MNELEINAGCMVTISLMHQICKNALGAWKMLAMLLDKCVAMEHDCSKYTKLPLFYLYKLTLSVSKTVTLLTVHFLTKIYFY